MSTCKIGRTQWFYQEKGKGTPVVLVHGFPLDQRVWSKQLEGLGEQFRVITVDLKGFGKSASTDAFTIDAMADDLAKFLQQIDASNCVLGGLSMGGYVGLSLAKRYPQLLKGLMIVCSKAEGDTAAGKEGRQKMAELALKEGAAPVAAQMMPKMFCARTFASRPELVQQLQGIMEACPPLTIANACFAMRDRADRTADLPELTMPVLVLLGELDGIIPVAMGQQMAGACRRGTLAVIPGAGHMAPMEEPAAVNQALAQWINGLG